MQAEDLRALPRGGVARKQEIRNQPQLHSHQPRARRPRPPQARPHLHLLPRPGQGLPFPVRGLVQPQARPREQADPRSNARPQPIHPEEKTQLAPGAQLSPQGAEGQGEGVRRLPAEGAGNSGKGRTHQQAAGPTANSRAEGRTAERGGSQAAGGEQLRAQTGERAAEGGSGKGPPGGKAAAI